MAKARGVVAGGRHARAGSADRQWMSQPGTVGRLARRAIEHGFQTLLAKPLSPGALDDLLDGGAVS